MSANNVWRRYPSKYLTSRYLLEQRPCCSAQLVADDFFRMPISVKVTWAEFEVPAAGAVGTLLKYWTGAAWVPKPLKRWNGSAWVPATLKRWNGSAWVAT